MNSINGVEREPFMDAAKCQNNIRGRRLATVQIVKHELFREQSLFALVSEYSESVSPVLFSFVGIRIFTEV